MEIEEFVTGVLKQLESSLAAASTASREKQYQFDNSIKFDLAVTHRTSKEGEGSGKVKAKNILIVDLDANLKGKLAAGHEVVQRIQFDVHAGYKDGPSNVVEASSPGRALFPVDGQY